MNRVVIAGGVGSTKVTLEKLIEHKMDVAGVFGYEPKNIRTTSGYAKLDKIAQENGIPYRGFLSINDSEIIKEINNLKPDILFIVGLSQLVSENILKIPVLGTIGFHPTVLPSGRGRAPLAWLVLNEKHGAATFFVIDNGVDNGPVLAQEIFNIEPDDNAEDVQQKIFENISIALDKLLPEIKSGIWNPIPQEEYLASYYGKRTPEDGIINWNDKAENILKLIRAASKPHPGAFSFFNDYKVIIWNGALENNIKIKGVISRILIIDEAKGYLIQTGDGLIWIKDLEFRDFDDNIIDNISVRTGQRFGYSIENEIYKIKHEIKKLREQ